jgi:hypothetical protein
MTWQPLDHVPDPLQLGLCDALRTFVLQRDLGLGIERDAEGLLVVPLAEGTVLRVGLTVTSRVAVRFGARQALRIDLGGRAVRGRTSYGLAGRAILDLKTKAFLDVDCDIVWTDAGA